MPATAAVGTWRNLRVAIKTLVVHDALAGGKVGGQPGSCPHRSPDLPLLCSVSPRLNPPPQARQRHRAIIEAAISKSLQVRGRAVGAVCDVRGLRQLPSRPPSHAHVQHPNVVTTYEAEVVPLAVMPAAAAAAGAVVHTTTQGKPMEGPVAAVAAAGDDYCDVYKLLIIQVSKNE